MLTILLTIATITVVGFVGGFLVADYFDFQDHAESQARENGNNAQN